MFSRHPVVSAMTLAYLAVVAWLTLTSTGPESGILERLAGLLGRYPATDWFTFMRLEFVANVAMFVPFGVFFVLLLGRRRWWLAVIVGVLMTLGIEGIQQFIPSRVPDVRDLLANSIGTTAGVLVARAMTLGRVLGGSRGTGTVRGGQPQSPRRRESRRESRLAPPAG